ncbi:Replication factor C subunit, putative [Pediculus humanus corporis]|uniref:Replication factor C subunit 2 n=1 Tax=Pediculus humanus subsp. corporis TaxID=121224 RepID=E0W2F5_PEDHC|nr:Replication factor C subunit, putative [Pediculus humanus corporis]EEB19811.1 Replication factor C subunit, putative [Pediculus humanus corporis]
MEGFLKTGKLGNNSNISSISKTDSLKGKEENYSNIPWVEKYRPKTVDDIVEQVEVVSVLRQTLKGADLPNLLFYGPPGTGKTSTILAAARQLFGDMFKERILELNASDDRGIQVIRDKVKTFAQLSASSTRPDGQPCPPFKIVLLDEADSMTSAAQAALRRTMELYTKTTRFCLVCNYVSRIIPPITSRCSKFRFKPLGENKIFERLSKISKAEKVNINDDTLMTLVKCTGGDLRRAITSLQSCARIKEEGELITIEDVNEVAGVIPDSVITELINTCNKNNYTTIEDFVNEVTYQAYSVAQLMEQLTEYIIQDFKLSDKAKATIFDKLSLCSSRLIDGASEYLLLIDLCCTIAKALQLS